MKNSILIVALMAVCSHAQAGLLITKAGKVSFGDIIEKKESISLAVKVGDSWGSMTYKRSAIYWYTADKRVTTYSRGAVYAYKTKAYKAAKFLAKIAMKKEPKYKSKMIELIALIDSLKKIEDPVAKAKKEIEGDE